jgi:hypothetical protein
MNIQIAFNKVVRHLLKQKQAARAGGRCVYRSPEGLKCAVGCLISDKAYDPFIEGKGLKGEPVKRALELSGVPVDDRSLEILYQTLCVHDMVPVPEWRTNLEEIARKYALKFPVLRVAKSPKGGRAKCT